MIKIQKTYSETNYIDMSYITESDKVSDLYEKLQKLADALNELTANTVFLLERQTIKMPIIRSYLYIKKLISTKLVSVKISFKLGKEIRLITHMVNIQDGVNFLS